MAVDHLDKRTAISATLAIVADGQAARAADGIPATTQLSKSCTSTRPPLAATAAAPRAPSSPMPLSTTAITFMPASTAELNSRSALGWKRLPANSVAPSRNCLS
jgi:hypothetical protein